jgi:hypothetical protein
MMSLSRPLLLAILSATTTLGLLTLGAPSVASAAVAPNAVPNTAHASYHPVAAAGTVAPNTTSPSGCIQRADYPHKSKHVPGTADGVVTTTCTQYVPEMAFTAQMWETRWWGWDRIGHKASVARFSVQKLSISAWDYCKKNTVRTTGSGYVIDLDHRTYYASTESIHVKNPCGL